jgi:hypothetical protein
MVYRNVFGVGLALAFAVQPVCGAPGYRLHQRSDFYGCSIAEVSARSMCLQSERLQLKLHVSSPEYQLTALNDRNRQYAKIPFKRWEGFIGDTHKHAARGQLFRGYVNICGLRAEEWWVDSSGRDSVTDTSCKSLFYQGKSYNTHYFVTKDIAPPKHTFGVFTNALGMPGYLGLPVRMIQYTKAGRPYVTFDTTKVEKCDVNESLAVPKGYEVAADEMSLLISAAMDKEKLAVLLDDDDEAFLGGLNPKKGGRKQREQIRGWVPGMETVGKNAVSAGKAGLGGSWTPGD